MKLYGWIISWKGKKKLNDFFISWKGNEKLNDNFLIEKERKNWTQKPHFCRVPS